MFSQPIVGVSSYDRQQNVSSSNKRGQQSASSASVAAARRRFTASTVIDSATDGNDSRLHTSRNNNNATTSTSSETVPTFNNNSITVATPREVNAENASRLRGAPPPRKHTNIHNSSAFTKNSVPAAVSSTTTSTQALFGSSGSPSRWTTNLYREYRPNTVIRCVEAFEKSLTTPSVEARLHALRSVFHTACDGAEHRRAIRQRLPKLVGAVAAVCNETDPTRPSGNKLHDVAFRLMTVMLGDGECWCFSPMDSNQSGSRGSDDADNAVIRLEGERMDNTVVLDESLMSITAPRALLAGGDATFAVASCLRRMSELPSIAHAIVHNDVLLDCILRVLEEENIWHTEITAANAQQQQQQPNNNNNNNSANEREPSPLSSVLHPKKSVGGSTTYLNNNNNNNDRSNSAVTTQSSTNSTNNNNNPSGRNPSASMYSAMSIEGAAAVIQLRIALLNICSRPSGATFVLSKSQRFVSLLSKDAQMGVIANKELERQLSEYLRQQEQQQRGSSNNKNNGDAQSFSLSDTLLLNAEQRNFVKSFSVGGAVLEEKATADLANGKRRLFLPSHVVAFALTGTIFDPEAAAASADALSSMPSHPSVPSEGGGAIPFSRAAHRANQTLQCRLEASRLVHGEDELFLLAAVSAVFALHTLHSIAMREEGAALVKQLKIDEQQQKQQQQQQANSKRSNNNNSNSCNETSLVKALATLIHHRQNTINNNTNSSNQSGMGGNGPSPKNNNVVVAMANTSPQAVKVVLSCLRSSAMLALDVFEESDSQSILRKLENFSTEGKAMLDKLRSSLY